MYAPTEYDYILLDQPTINFYLKVEVKNDDGTILDNLEGIISTGGMSIDAESDIRRTTSVTIIPIINGLTLSNGVDKDTVFDLTEKSNIWIDKTAILYCGIKDIRTEEITWYKMGTFRFQNTSIVYDATTNQMTVNCGDLMTLLDGTINGQLGQLVTKIPAYEEDPETGEPTEYYIIRDSMAQTITQLGNIDKYMIDDLGEFKGMKQYNPDWQEYREHNPLWNNVPYDLEFSSGCTVLQIVAELRDLYPNYESYFDEDGVFICQMIPSCYYDDIYLADNILQKYLISENTTRDLTVVKNVSEVWGQILETDFYSEEVGGGSTYTATIEGMDEEQGYKNGDRVALKVPNDNSTGQMINLNNFGAVTIYDENTEAPIAAGIIEADKVYVFKFKKERVDGETEQRWYLQGEFQVHALSVLTDGTVGPDQWTNPDTGEQVDKYSEAYFQQKYNVVYVDLTVNPESPFTVQKIGERPSVFTDDNISSDTLALARAHFNNWQTCRLTDNITLTTLLLPWLDVNTKVSYRMQNSDMVGQYIVKNIQHDFSGMTSQITMMTFYPLYEEHITG